MATISKGQHTVFVTMEQDLTKERVPYVRLTEAASVSDLRKRSLKRKISRVAAILLKREMFLNCLLFRKLQTLGKAGRGFYVPVPIVIKCLGERLHINCKLDEIVAVMADWINESGRKLHVSDYFLSAGEWEGIMVRAGTSSVDIEAEELHNHNWNYRSTKSYEKYLKAAEQGAPLRRQQILLTKRDLIDQYFDRFVALYYSIKNYGLISHSKLPDNLKSKSKDRSIGIAIGKLGQLCFLPGGQHRTAIARVLGLSEIPVEVRHVHADWLQNEIKCTGLSPVSALRHGITSIATRTKYANVTL